MERGVTATEKQHQTNVFTLTVKEKLKGWLEEKPYVSAIVYMNPSQAVFELPDIQAGRTLLSDCIRTGLTVTRFEQKTESLEDVYLKVVHA